MTALTFGVSRLPPLDKFHFSSSSHNFVAIMDVVKLATTVLECYSAWAGAAPTDLIVSEISGGLTNLIYLVKLEPKVHATMPKKPPTQVLLRLFGASTDGLINRDNELVCLDIAAGLGLGPRVLAQFKGKLTK